MDKPYLFNVDFAGNLTVFFFGIIFKLYTIPTY